MTSQKDSGFPILKLIVEILSIPYNLLAGFVVGAMVPVAAIAAIVAGVRLITGKMPFLDLVEDEGEGERHLAVALLPPERAEELFTEQRKQIGDEISRLKSEIQAIVQEARLDAQETTLESADEALKEVEEAVEG
ncbi:MAG: hypothetical protein ACK2UC_03490 [Anaerolineae bacterium]|jgi:hypothetical protein